MSFVAHSLNRFYAHGFYGWDQSGACAEYKKHHHYGHCVTESELEVGTAHYRVV